MESLIELNNWKQLFYSTKEGIKNYTEFVVDALKPKAFKDDMKSYVRFHGPAKQADHTALIEEMLNKVVHYEHHQGCSL